jgi:hypothetical protein
MKFCFRMVDEVMLRGGDFVKSKGDDARPEDA